jgi:hypothetical protein
MKRENRILIATLLCTLFGAAPHSSAIIRSPYPVKPLPPYRGNFIVIGGDSIVVPAESARATTAKPGK